MKHFFKIPYFLFLIGLIALCSCQPNDDVAPIITLAGDTLVNHPLNQAYTDAGASAQDETDGDISSSIFVNNPVDVNLIGEYLITYSVVDQAGNEALEKYRRVIVYNQAQDFEGKYSLHENEVPPGSGLCDSLSYIRVDSNFNWRIVFTGFACNPAYEVVADIYDTLLVMPFQFVNDSTQNLSIQGSGSISDSSMFIEYKKTTQVSTYWQASLQRIE